MFSDFVIWSNLFSRLLSYFPPAENDDIPPLEVFRKNWTEPFFDGCDDSLDIFLCTDEVQSVCPSCLFIYGVACVANFHSKLKNCFGIMQENFRLVWKDLADSIRIGVQICPVE
jgi:hypothetical protein